MSRIKTFVLSEMAERCPSEIKERWKVARATLEDPTFWDLKSPEAVKEQFGKYRRSRPSPQLGRYVEKLVRVGILKETPRNKIKLFLRGFIIPKLSKKKVRIIINAIPTNELFSSIPKVMLPTRAALEKCVRKFNFFLEADGVSYYNQYTMGPECQKFFGLRINGKNYVWTTAVMGWSSSVFIGQAGVEVLGYDDEDRLEDVDKLLYIDNVYTFGMTAAATDRSWSRMKQRTTQADAVFEVTTPTCTEGDVLGVHINLESRTMSLTQKIVDKLKLLDSKLDLVQYLTHRDAWKIFGSINWAAGILGTPMCSYPIFWFWVLRRASVLAGNPLLWDRPVFWNEAIRADLQKLLKKLIENIPRTVNESRFLDTESLYVDASNSGIGAYLPSQDDFYARPLTQPESKKRIAFAELVALYEGLRWAKRRRPDVNHWDVFTDNTNVASWWKRKKGPSFSHCQLLQKIIELGMDFDLQWISTKENLADKPSRVFATPYAGAQTGL